MLRTILAYPSLWCYEWNRLVGWVGLVIKTTGCSRSTIWISERWINLVIKTQEIKMQFKEVIMYSNAHIWIKYGLKDNTKKLCQSSNNLIKKRICVIQLRNNAFNEYLVSTQHTKLHFIISYLFIYICFICFEHEQMFQNVHSNSNKIMYIDKLVLTLP